MEAMRGVGKTHAIDDGIDAAGRCAGGAKIAEVRVEDFGLRQLAELALEAGAVASDGAKRNPSPRQFRRNGMANGAGRAEESHLLNVRAHVRG